MRSGRWCLLMVVLAMAPQLRAEVTESAGTVVPSSHSAVAAGQIADLQAQLKESERQREELTRQAQVTDRDSPLVSRLRQENQKLKLQLKEALSAVPPRILTEQQQWFVAGGGVAMLALLCGIFVSGWRRQRRQWLN